MFIGAYMEIWKQPKRPLMDKWIKKMLCGLGWGGIHTQWNTTQP